MTDIIKDFIGNNLLTFLINLLLGLLVLIIGLKISSFIVKRIKKSKVMKKLDSNILALLSGIIKVILYTVIIIVSVQIMGVPSATIVTVLGSCGLAIGLALQGGLSNIAGGVIIMITKPYHIGDYIITSDGEGTVEDIDIFYTRLRTLDNHLLNIPNSVLSSSTVNNTTKDGIRHLDVDVEVPYGTDTEKARNVLIECARSYDKVLNTPEPVVYVSAQKDFSVTMKLRVHVKVGDYWDTMCVLNETTMACLAEENIFIPFPQMDVHVKQ